MNQNFAGKKKSSSYGCMGMKQRYCGLMAIKATNIGHAKGL
jgi:hypothetical protein